MHLNINTPHSVWPTVCLKRVSVYTSPDLLTVGLSDIKITTTAHGKHVLQEGNKLDNM